MTVPVPAVGDTGTAAWADLVANDINSLFALTGISLTNTVAIGAPTAGTNTLITSWPTQLYNDGDIAYASGIFTPATAGKYRWDLAVTWPTGTVTARVFQGAFIGGSVVTRGQQGSQYLSGDGSRTITTGYVEKLAAGGTVQAFINHSAASITGITPAAFALTRVG
jgi:hypothetical protein